MAERGLPSGVVTFLLTDIVGSTRLWESAPEAMSVALAEHEQIISAAVAAHRGVTVRARSEGDSTFSVFARASDAMGAAFDAATSLASTPWPTGAELRVRMAVHTGEAVERDDDYTGRSVNRAARLCGIADGGQVLVSAATAELVNDSLPPGGRLIGLGVRELADLDRPEVVWLLTYDTDAAIPPAEPSHTEATMTVALPDRLARAAGGVWVGRSPERDALADGVEQAAAGARHAYLVSGEAGIGKTTLVSRVACDAHGRGAIVLLGRCEDDSSVPYGPWVSSLDHLVAGLSTAALDRVGDRRLSELARLLPAVADRCPQLQPPAPGEPEMERYLLFGAVTGLLTAATRDAPLVLVLDDLHWADTPTLQLLRHVCGSVDVHRLVVFATYRDAELTSEHPLPDLLATLRREPTVNRVTLTGLSQSEIADLIVAVTGAELDVDFATRLWRDTDGNPFFATEIPRHLAATGSESVDRGVLELPDSVREVVRQRVSRLGPTVEETLTVAALVGREFDPAAVAAALEQPLEAVLDTLEQAEEAMLVSSAGLDRFAFSHAIVATTLATDLAPTRRGRLHRKVGEALEARWQAADSGAPVGDLARHWSAAVPRDDGRAVTYAARAAAQALASLAPDEAIRWYQRALELFDAASDGPLPSRAQLLVGLGTAQRRTGDQRFRTTLLDAAQRAERAGDTASLVAAALSSSRGLAGAVGTVDVEIVELLERALNAVGLKATPDRARVLGTLANELAYAPDDARRRTIADEAVNVARQTRDEGAVLHVLLAIDEAIRGPDSLRERRVNAAEAQSVARAIGDRSGEFWAATWLTGAAACSGDLTAIERHRATVSGIANEVGDPLLRWMAAYVEVWVLLLRGDAAAAEGRAGATLEIGRESGHADADVVYGAQLQAIRWHQGRTPELVEAISEAVEDHPDVPAYRAALAIAYSDAGETNLATALLVAEAATGFYLPHGGLWLTNSCVWAYTSGWLREPKSAEILIERLAPFDDQIIFSGYAVLGTVAHVLGGLADALDRRDDAEAYFAHAQVIEERLQAPLFVARTKLSWGRMLVERGESDDDRERGGALLAESAMTAASIGSRIVEARARDLSS